MNISIKIRRCTVENCWYEAYIEKSYTVSIEEYTGLANGGDLRRFYQDNKAYCIADVNDEHFGSIIKISDTIGNEEVL